MITLYSYPGLYGLEDNNPYGQKVFAFLRLCGLPFEHRHILDAKAAPRAQLPYLVDEATTIGDSDAIIAHLKQKYASPIDDALTHPQRDLDLLIRRTLDDLYWVMSYSRWADARYWPVFKDAILTTHPGVTAEALDGARKYNFERYHYQGIGQVVTLRVPASRLREVNRAIENTAWGGYRTEFYPTYDYKAVAQQMHETNGK